MATPPSADDLVARIRATHHKLVHVRAVYAQTVWEELGNTSPEARGRVKAADDALQAVTARLDAEKALLVQTCQACVTRSEQSSQPPGCPEHRALLWLV
jgi:hypothetical protein